MLSNTKSSITYGQGKLRVEQMNEKSYQYNQRELKSSNACL